MFVWVLLYLSSSGADFSWFWLLVSMRKSNGLCVSAFFSPLKKKETREWAKLGFISSFAIIFLSFERNLCVWMSWVLPFGDQQVRVRTNHWWLQINLCLLFLHWEKSAVKKKKKKDDLDTGQQSWGKKVTLQTFLVKKQLYNAQEESIYWKLSSFLIACMCWALFFCHYLWMLRMVDVEDDGCGCVYLLNRRVGLFVMLREVDNDTKPG